VITIKDVAERAGVGISTVSYVLNGNLKRVGPATRERVLEAMRDLNYRPNAVARSMVKRSTKTIGLVIMELDNPLFVPVTHGVEAILRDEDYHILLVSVVDLEGEVQAIETLRSQQVDGFIFMSLSIRYPSDHILRLKEEGIPFVLINRYLEDSEVNLVRIDDFGAGLEATRHLVSLGHTKLGIISGPIYNKWDRRSPIQRYAGWEQILKEYELPVQPEWVILSDYTFEGGYQAIQQLLAQTTGAVGRPTALFVANESMAVGALQALHEHGLRVPQDIAIVSVGDPPFAAYTIPALSTFSLPMEEAGQTAARILLDWIKSEKAPEPQQIVLPCTPRIRQSCGTKLNNLERKLWI
jgi:LacI family transcriptional regulator